MFLSNTSVLNLPKLHTTLLFFPALLLIVLTMPYAYAISSISVFIFAGLWLLDNSWSEKWNRLQQSPLAWLFMAVYLIEAIGLLYTSNLPEGLFILQKKVLLFAFPLLLATIPPFSEKQIKILLAAFVVTCVAGSLVCLAQGLYHALVLGHTKFLFYHQLAAFIDMQGIYLSLYTGFSALILVYYLLYQPSVMSATVRKVATVTSVYLIGFTVLLSIRTTLAALLFLLVLLIAIYFYRKRQLLKGFLAIAGLIMFVTGSIFLNPVSSRKFREAFDKKETIPLNNQSDQSLGRGWGGKALRFAIWQCTVDVIGNNFWLGVGTGSAQDALQEGYRKRNFDFAYLYNSYNAHNQYLETWISAGIGGLAVLLLSFVVPLYMSFRTGNLLHVLLILFFAINCLTESMFERQKGVIFYAFFNSLLAFRLLRKQNLRRADLAGI